MKRPELIVFDINKTLIKESSWLDLNIAMGVTPAEDDQLMSWGAEGVISDQTGQQILCSIYKKRAQPTRANIAEIVCNFTYLDGAKESVRALQERGYEVALISGAMDVLVEEIAGQLGISHWRANNTFVFDEQGLLARIDTANNDSQFKVEAVNELCAELGVDTGEIMSIGDGDNDIDLFAASGMAVTFTYASDAAKAAAQHHIDRLEQLLSLVE